MLSARVEVVAKYKPIEPCKGLFGSVTFLGSLDPSLNPHHCCNQVEECHIVAVPHRVNGREVDDFAVDYLIFIGT